MKPPALRIALLTPRRWKDLEKLFGPNGAAAGCWCTFWRLEKGERYADLKGAKAKKKMKAMVADGRAEGLLAYRGKEPVGWLTLGKRKDFPALDRAPSLQCDDAERVWSVPCFFIKPGHRGSGVAGALLEAAVEELRRRRAAVIEGYPLKPPRPGEKIPAAFAWTGTLPLFQKQGFKVVAAKAKGKQRVRREL
jgi:GNAT superfamily N-acetyltransferase